MLREVEVQALDAARLEPLIGRERLAQFERMAEATQARLAGRSVINVNSTAAGGGVAEMLQTLLAYARGAGVDARWLVIEGDPAFFAITKRIHNGLYGSPGDGGELGEEERRHYEDVLAQRRRAARPRATGRPRAHTRPATCRAAAAVKRAGARVVWRCHVGTDEPNQWTERAWEFLRPYLVDVEAIVVSRAAFAPPWADPARVHVIPPSIDPFSAKNEPISGPTSCCLCPTSACLKASVRRPRCRSPAGTARPAGSTGASTSCRPGRRRLPTARSSRRFPAGIA